MQIDQPDIIDQKPSNRFRHSYLAALSLIALIIFISQYYINHTIADQEADGLIINLSGRQRYTSQRIVKCMYIMAGTKDSTTFATRRTELTDAIATWQRSHFAFLHGDSALKIHNRNNTPAIAALFAEIQPHFDAVVAGAGGFLAVAKLQVPNGQTNEQDAILEPYLAEVIEHELPFLMGMDAIVKAYAEVSHQKVLNLAETEFWLSVFMLLTLLLEALFIFRPALRAMKSQMQQLSLVAAASNRAHEELKGRHEELTWKNAYIEKMMHSTTESINYAQRIQHSLMPTEMQLRQTLPHLFLYYKPRDIVSGDFYWFKEIGDKIYLAVADCTGHGVPGCLMSVLGINLLADVIDKYPNAAPHELLEELDNRLTAKLMGSAENEVEDGMDIALCCISKSSMTLDFSSAKQPLILVRAGELLIYKGTRRSLGNPLMRHTPFSTQRIEIEASDFIYLFSDGMTDQFGAGAKRYGSARLCEFLRHQAASIAIEKQHALLSNEMNSWQQDALQTDDMLLIGMKLSQIKERLSLSVN